MGKAGADYEKEAQRFFASVGLNAEWKEKVKGARGEFEVDVWVTGRLGPFDVRWIVECKAWSSNVTQEKVSALKSVMLEVGADHGWLLSEKGFQSGAKRCAEYSNITLTSLKCLREKTKEFLREAKIQKLLSIVEDLSLELEKSKEIKSRQADPRKGFWYIPNSCSRFNSRLSHLSNSLKKGLRNDYPVLCDVIEVNGKEVPIIAKSTDELIEIVNEDVKKLEMLRDVALKDLHDEEM